MIASLVFTVILLAERILGRARAMMRVQLLEFMSFSL
jgi:hypothetical protein